VVKSYIQACQCDFLLIQEPRVVVSLPNFTAIHIVP
jgi:hypothetical protein